MAWFLPLPHVGTAAGLEPLAAVSDADASDSGSCQVQPNPLSQLVSAASTPNGYSAGTNPVQVGLGVRVGSIDNNMAAGGVETTGNATDVNIQGNGGCASPTAMRPVRRLRSTRPSTPVPATSCQRRRDGGMARP